MLVIFESLLRLAMVGATVWIVWALWASRSSAVDFVHGCLECGRVLDSVSPVLCAECLGV